MTARTMTLLLGLALLASGCTSAPAPTDGAEAPAYAEVACPDDVTQSVVATVECGELTVPRRRSDGDAGSLRLFVARVQPGEPTDDEPIFIAGTDLGDVPNLPGIAPMAQRTGREVIVLHPRGTGRSEPALACPELTDVRDTTLRTVTDDPATRDGYLAAVGSCHARLSGEGVELADVDLTAMAADAEDLRRAAGIGTWNVVAFGTQSRVVLEMLRQEPDHVRAVLLDSPEWPGLDPRAVAAEAAGAALDAVLDACAQDPACPQQARADRTLATAVLDGLDAAPATVQGRSDSGQLVDVRLDGARLHELLRHVLLGDSRGGLYRPELAPSVLAAVQDGRTDVLSALADALPDQGPYCLGFQPRCSTDGRGLDPVDLTVLCRDIAPFSSARPPAGPAGHAGALSRSPYYDVCEHWPVSPGPKAVADPVESDVPVLAMVGAFSSRVRPEMVGPGLAGLRRLTVAVDPTGGYNVMPSTDCMLGIRQAFLDDPTRDLPVQCLQDLRPEWQ